MAVDLKHGLWLSCDLLWWLSTSKHTRPSWPEQCTLLLNTETLKKTSLEFVLECYISAWCYYQCQVASFIIRRFKFPNTQWTSYDFLNSVKHHYRRRVMMSRVCPPGSPKGKGIITNSCSLFPSFVLSSIITPSGEWFPCLSSVDLYAILPLSLRTNIHKHTLSAFLLSAQKKKRLGGSGFLATRLRSPHHVCF